MWVNCLLLALVNWQDVRAGWQAEQQAVSGCVFLCQQQELSCTLPMSTEDPPTHEDRGPLPIPTPTMIPMADLTATIRDVVNEALSARLPPPAEGSVAGSSRGKRLDKYLLVHGMIVASGAY